MRTPTQYFLEKLAPYFTHTNEEAMLKVEIAVRWGCIVAQSPWLA